jgi:hypothetical protein|tara:strand:- start:250 stop:432 length:183 start_codon:yes stop_codon:yes gene_type:complete
MENDDLHEQIKLAYSLYMKENDKFESGVKSSAVRARQALNELKALIPHRRKEIQDKKSDM